MIRFQAYFKKGLRYLSGGVKTGLSHYVEDKNPKLFHVKVIVSIFTITNIKLKSICQYIKILQHPMHVPSIVIVIVSMFNEHCPWCRGEGSQLSASVWRSPGRLWTGVALLPAGQLTSLSCRGDSYVLDVPLSNKVLIWRGANSNRWFSSSWHLV